MIEGLIRVVWIDALMFVVFAIPQLLINGSIL